jgi:putrescine transport system ATP-binding protein
MALSTRIAVMNRGRIVQTGTPTDIYEYPNCRFSADFIGSINLFEGKVGSVADGQVTVMTEEVGPLQVAHAGAVLPGAPVSVAVRPEKIAIAREPPCDAPNTLQGTVFDLGYFGDRSLFRVQLGNGRLVSVSRQNERRGREEDRQVDWDDRVWLSWTPASALLLTE